VRGEFNKEDSGYIVRYLYISISYGFARQKSCCSFACPYVSSSCHAHRDFCSLLFSPLSFSSSPPITRLNSASFSPTLPDSVGWLGTFFHHHHHHHHHHHRVHTGRSRGSTVQSWLLFNHKIVLSNMACLRRIPEPPPSHGGSHQNNRGLSLSWTRQVLAKRPDTQGD